MEWKKIRFAGDVTDDHVAEAKDMRDGLYGDGPLPWDEVIDRIEAADEDWGDSMESKAIKELKRRVRIASSS
jgi:hypothetical protein